MQRELSEFESHLAAFLGVKYALGVDNATDGLFIALRAAGIGPGDEVIFSSHTMVATAAAIHFAGATPIPVECGRDHLIDPAAIDSAITARTRAVLPTQLNGRTCDMDAICATAARHNLLIIEDAAQGLGSKFKNRHAGSFGVAAAISFYPAKVLGCLGDGGALVANDDGLYQRAAQLRDHGRGADGEIVSWGLNSRLDNIQAAILDRRLQRYHAVVSRRRALASLYQQRLGDLPELLLPPGPDAGPDHFDVYQNYEIEAHNRDELRAHLSRQGIGTLIQWGGKAVHQWSKLGFIQRLPYTDYLFTRLLMLPLNMSLTDDDVHYVSTCIRKFYGR
jgi:dTDP-4-amino-4,6-dideoxygalactose transaminase